MNGWSLDKTAERFDELYTRMTGLQRRLIEAVRSGDEADSRTRSLVDEARAVIAACEAAGRSLDVGYDARAVEARALAARVLHPPLDGVPILAATRSLTRAYGYPLLADALEQETAGDDDALPHDVWGERTVLDLLSAPQSMGEYTARLVAEHVGLPAESLIAELHASDRARLIAGLRETADQLPESAARGGRRPKLPEDGSGAGPDVLDRWIGEIGTGTDPVRQAARQVAQRSDWPEDAVPVAAIIVRFTDEQLMPLIVPNYELLAAEADLGQRLTAMRAEERSYLRRWRELSDGDDGEQEAATICFALSKQIEALRTIAKAEQMAALAPEQWRSASPLSNARIAARRCGEILSMFDEEAVALIDRLPRERAPVTDAEN